MFTFCKDNHHDPRLLEINSSATFSNSPSSSSTSATARPNVYALIVLGIVLDVRSNERSVLFSAVMRDTLKKVVLAGSKNHTRNTTTQLQPHQFHQIQSAGLLIGAVSIQSIEEGAAFTPL